MIISYENKENEQKNKSSLSHDRSISLTFALNGGKDSISLSAIYKTVFQWIAPLLEIAKFVNFIVNLGIV